MTTNNPHPPVFSSTNVGNNPGNPNASGYFGGDQLGTESLPESTQPIPDGQLAYEERLAEQNAFGPDITEQERVAAAQTTNALLARDADGNLVETNPRIRGLMEEYRQGIIQRFSENVNTPDMRYVYLRDGVDQTYINAPLNDTTTSSVMRFGASLQNLYNSRDMLEIEMQIRGDPYWIGQPRSVYGFSTLENAADFELGSSYFFLNINLPSENGPSKEYMITGLYRVISVISEYRNGKFVQYLKAYREAIINTRTVIAALESGEGIMPNIAPNAPLDGSAGSNGGRVGGGQTGPTAPGDQGDGLREPAEANGEPFVPEEFEGDHRLQADPRQAEINRVLAQTGDELGITVIQSDGPVGYREIVGINSEGVPYDTANSTSGRHQRGAADVQLVYQDRILNINNPNDVAAIQAFTERFYQNTTSAGQIPGVGIGTNYMSGTSFHYDISGRGYYWGNGEEMEGAPDWLARMDARYR